LYLDVMIVEDLARETDLPEEVAALQNLTLGLRHPPGLTFEELDTADGSFA
jgi:hypothetical protein